mmetsp:Transcript_84164/g.236620  ORF Transcript_84164/g.236620 Transcript_84164/m.236620 type:complete len:315 (-) Transcript_84164:59-1003(-)
MPGRHTEAGKAGGGLFPQCRGDVLRHDPLDPEIVRHLNRAARNAVALGLAIASVTGHDEPIHPSLAVVCQDQNLLPDGILLVRARRLCMHRGGGRPAPRRREHAGGAARGAALDDEGHLASDRRSQSLQSAALQLHHAGRGRLHSTVPVEVEQSRVHPVDMCVWCDLSALNLGCEREPYLGAHRRHDDARGIRQALRRRRGRHGLLTLLLMVHCGLHRRRQRGRHQPRRHACCWCERRRHHGASWRADLRLHGDIRRDEATSVPQEGLLHDGARRGREVLSRLQSDAARDTAATIVLTAVPQERLQRQERHAQR